MAALRPYQKKAVNWLLSTTAIQANRFLVLDPGLGKTAVAITAAYAGKLDKVLVVCPAVARPIWKWELAKWWPEPDGSLPEILTIEPGTPPTAPVPHPGWTICAYSMLSIASLPWRARLSQIQWDLLIIDECQYLKSHSNRTHAVYGRRLDALAGSLAGAADQVWLLSGTPAPNHAGELYTHLRALFPQTVPTNVRNHYDFEDRYCNVRDTVYGRRIVGSNLAAIPDLRARIKSHVLRRRREDVLTDLPAISFYDTPIDALLVGGPTLPVMDDDRLIEYLNTNHSTQIATARRQLGEVKASPAAAFCEELLDELPVGRRKLVVFAHHRSVIATLAEELKDWDPVVLDGSTTPRQREGGIERFQQDPDHAHVFIGQIQAAGTAISLTAAHTAVFVECSWVPAENYQAALRIHRLGQAYACDVHFLYAPGSLDETIMRAYRRKASELAQLLE